MKNYKHVCILFLDGLFWNLISGNAFSFDSFGASPLYNHGNFPYGFNIDLDDYDFSST